MLQVNCISTEFTPKKHGGEKGVPFRIMVETRLPGGSRLHAASCQVKVFKLKGADRKHKQDRDKILRRPPHEQDKYQPSYDCTVLSDVSNLPRPAHVISIILIITVVFSIIFCRRRRYHWILWHRQVLRVKMREVEEPICSHRTSQRE